MITVVLVYRVHLKGNWVKTLLSRQLTDNEIEIKNENQWDGK